MKSAPLRRRLGLLALLLGLAALGVWWGRGMQVSAPGAGANPLVSASSPKASADATSVASAAAPPSAISSASFPPVSAAAANAPLVARLLAFSTGRQFSSAQAPATDRWPRAETLAVGDGPAFGEIRTRVRIVKSDFKHPLLRLEEAYRIDVTTGAETLLAQEAMVADHLILKPAPGVSASAFLPHLTTLGGTVRSVRPASGLHLVTVPAPLDPASLPATVEAWKALAGIVSVAEPDFVVHAVLTPDDPAFPQLHGLHNTGQSGGVADADIDAPEAWEIATGSRAILVGVIDTGIDHTHPDLAANMWSHPGEIAGNGLDDDGNGYVDDVRGWDFVNDDNNPSDDHSHGTHCAGTIGAVGGNGLGLAGVAHQVSLVGLKFLSASGSGAISDAAEAVAYSTRLGCHLTSNSWGGGGYSQSLHDVIAAAAAGGRLFVAAAGNNGRNTDLSLHYPSGYALDNIVAVAATDHADALASFSNHGAASVDLGAPGVDIYSTKPGNTYGNLSGTSMAAPHVAGAAALILGRNPALPGLALKSLLLATVDPKPALAGKTVTGGRLNLYSALSGTDQLLVTPSSGWTASGPVGGTFPAAGTTVTLSNLDSVTHGWTAQLDVPWASLSAASGAVPAGGTTTFTVTLLASSAQQLPAGNHAGTLTVTDLANNRRHTRALALTVIPPPVFTFDLDTDPGWPRSGQWAHGQPAGQGGSSYGHPDPTAGHTGPHVFGINLQGDYATAPGDLHTLTAGPFDLTGYAATRLQFRRWLNSDYENWVSSRVEISTDGATWARLWSNAEVLVTDNAWTLQDFDLSAHADNRPAVYLRWVHQVVGGSSVWPLSGWNIDDVAILGAQPRSLRFHPMAPVAEEAGTANATLRLEPAPTSPLQIHFTSSAPGLVPAPASLTVPAGTESVEVTLTISDNALLDGTRTVLLTPTASDYSTASLLLGVQDNETATLSVLAPATAAEGGPAATATVQVSSAPGASVTVALASSLPEAAALPATVVIPAGATSASFVVNFPDNTRLEETRNVTLTATVDRWTAGQTSVAVADNDPRTLSVSLAPGLGEGRGALPQGGTVTLSGTLAAPLTVTLASSFVRELIVPASVVIPAGALSAKFDLTLPDDAEQDGAQTVTVTASAATFLAGTATASVGDNDPASFTFGPVASPQYVGQAFSATLTARDIHGAPASGFTGPVSLSGSLAGEPATLLPAQTGTFAHGVWSGAVTCQTAGENWTLHASSSGVNGVSNSFTVIMPVVRNIALANNDLIYDPATDRLYASTPSGTLVPIDRATGALGTPVTVANTATTLLARAGDGSRLWVAHDGGKQVRQISLPALAPGPGFTLPNGSTTMDMVALPEAPAALAVLESGGYYGEVRIYDNGVARPVVPGGYPNFPTPTSLEAGPAGRLYGYNGYSSGYDFYRFTVAANGASYLDGTYGLVSGYHVTIHADGDLVAASSGRVVDGSAPRRVSSLPYFGLVRPDAAAKRVYLLSDQGGGTRRLRAYDTDRFSEVGAADVSGVSGTPSQLIRVGAGGLAFRTPTQIFLLNTLLVPTPDSANLRVTQLATPDLAIVGQPLNYLVSVRNLGGGPAQSVVLTNTFPPAAVPAGIVASQGSFALSPTQITVDLGALPAGAEATLRFTITPSATGTVANTAQVGSATGDPDTANNTSTATITAVAAPATSLRRAALGARDIAYDSVSDRVLITTSNTATPFPNSLLRLDPQGLAALSADYLGDQPGRLRLTADGQYAYALLDGSVSVARAPIVRGSSAPLTFAVHQKPSSSGGLPRALDLAPVTGRPSAVAVTRELSSETVALYVDGVLQPVTTAYTNYTGVLADGPSAQRLYGYNNRNTGYEFYRLNVQSDGITTDVSRRYLLETFSVGRLKRAGSLLYTNTGHVLDPEAMTLVTNLGASGPVEPSLQDKRVYLFEGTTLRAFDLQTHAPAGSLALGTLDGWPINLVRCGGRSFAFLTDTGVLYLLDAPALVPPPPLRVILPARLTEGTGSVPGVGRLEIHRPAEADIAVTLTSSAPGVLDVTRTLVLPAGATSVPFSVEVADNTGLNGTRSVTVSASTPAAYTPEPGTVLVDDDETSALALSLPASVSEGAAPIPNQASVSIASMALTDILVDLVSSDTTELVVPATATIPAGASSASFTLTSPPDDLLDGTQSATITASVRGYTPASATLQVLESENLKLSVTLPSSAPESFTWVSATLTLPGKTLSPRVVSLSSSDTTELTVPATVTVPAGQTSVDFSCTAIDDNRKDGAVTTTVTASAPGFISGSGSVSLIDNDPSSAAWSLIPSPQTAGTDFSATLTLKTIDGLVPNWSGNVPVTAFNAAGEAMLAGAPAKILVVNGAGTASFAVLSAGAETKLRATMPAPASFAADSEPFTVSAGPHSTFTISSLADPQGVNQPVAVTVEAADAHGNLVSTYSGGAALYMGDHVRTLGTGTFTTSSLLNGSGLNTRTQIIYKASEIGGQGVLTSLFLDVTSAPTATLNSFTIRLKPTSLENYDSGANWEATGWTTVLSSSITVNQTGWVKFPFATPYVYDGAGNLLVDISFHNTSYFTSGIVRGGNPGGRRTMSASGYGSHGSPLTWSGGTPSTYAEHWVPNIRLARRPVGGGVTPDFITPFVAGRWSGLVTFTAPGGPLTLRAESYPRSGDSNPFTILPPPPVIEAEPPVTGGTSNTLAWSPGRPADTYVLEIARDATFTAPVATPPLAIMSHTASPLDEGPRFYRVKTRAAEPIGSLTYGSSHAYVLDDTRAGSNTGIITLANSQTTFTENFDGPGTALSDTFFSDVVGTPTRSALGAGMGPSTTPALPINQGGDLEAVFNGGYALRPAATAFTNGSIEAVVAPASPTAGTNTSTLLLRGKRSGDTLQSAYGAVLTFSSNATAKADFVHYTNGNTHWFNTTTNSFQVSASDNIRARFSIDGSRLSLSLWRLTASAGAIQETPINFAWDGGNTLVATSTTYSAAGAAGLRSGNTFAAQRTLFDDVIVRVTNADYLATGTVTSAEIVPPRLHRWGRLAYRPTTPAGTSVTFDVLSGAGAVLLTNIPNGTDLGAFAELVGHTSLRVRARLATTNPAFTPTLNWNSWSLAYELLPPQVYESTWSTAVGSIQDATAPALAITSPATTSTASYTLTGAATDANGIVALAINGQPAATTNGYGAWSRLLTLQPGENILTLLAADTATPANTRQQTFTVTYRPPDADADGLPDAWESAHFLDPASTVDDHGRLGDPDGDGLPNLLEYASGLDPRAPDVAPATLATQLHPETGASHLVFTYRRLIAPGEVAYAILESANLRDWAPPATAPEVLSVVPHVDNRTETVSLRLQPALDASPRFVRLRVDSP